MHATVRDYDGCVEESDIAKVHVKPAGLDLNPGIGPFLLLIYYNLENFDPPPPRPRKSDHAAYSFTVNVHVVLISQCL